MLFSSLFPKDFSILVLFLPSVFSQQNFDSILGVLNKQNLRRLVFE